jgi:hypothetical protein
VRERGGRRERDSKAADSTPEHLPRRMPWP